MKTACIDIGTNSIRLLLAEYDGKGFQSVQKKLQMTRLGKGVNETKMLNQERMDESVEAIAKFCEEAERYGAEKVLLMATSAVRDSKNSAEFTKRVFESTGYFIDIISGDLEAQVGFLGVLLGNDNSEETILVIDIGGGSTELIVGNKDGIQFARSLNMGAVRLTGAFITNDPVSHDETELVIASAKLHIEPVIEAIKSFNIGPVIGIGGTATTYATMQHEISQYSREKVHQLEVTLPELCTLNNKLEKLTVSERKHLIGLEEKRADIIYVGGLILQVILEAIDKDCFLVSDFDNLEGYIAYKTTEKTTN